jgi:hypothetical protein
VGTGMMRPEIDFHLLGFYQLLFQCHYLHLKSVSL